MTKPNVNLVRAPSSLPARGRSEPAVPPSYCPTSNERLFSETDPKGGQRHEAPHRRLEDVPPHPALAVVRSDMNALGGLVQRLAAAYADGGRAIVANVGVYGKNATGPRMGGFVVKQARVSGGARMIAKAERTRASCEWPCSLDEET
jgi:hypothetical protein